MRATLTGATGLVGSNLALQLLEAGHQVRCTRRRSSAVSHLAQHPIEWVEADLGDADSLTAAFIGADVVFHCAAEISFRRKVFPSIRATNVDGTRNVIEAVRRAGAGRLVHCSSVVACAISDREQPVTEEEAWNFDRFGLDESYAVTKLEAERLVQEAARRDVDAVIVNPCYMLGPYDPKPSSGKLILKVVEGNVPGWTDGFNNFVDVRDVCRGLIAAWEKGRRGERYILGGENMTYGDIFRRIAAVAGVKAPRFYIPRPLAALVGLAGDVQQWITGREALINSVTVRYSYCRGYQFSSEKARRELGYTPGPIDVAIRDALDWFRANGMLKT